MSFDKNFTNLKIHTQYSICEGAIKIDDLASHCKENKIKSIGIADSFNLCGALEFAEKISKVGTQPIIGSQINILYENILGKISVYAQSEKGYQNLTKLSSLSYLKNKKIQEPYIEMTDLVKNNEDLILLTGNYNNIIGKLFYLNKDKAIDKILDNFKLHFEKRIYLEILRHNEEAEKNFETYIFNLSVKHNLPLIASQEVFYLNQDMAEAHDALVCIGVYSKSSNKSNSTLFI